MNIGIIGSSGVAKTLAQGFLRNGDAVRLGSREPEKLEGWMEEIDNADLSAGTNAEAARYGEIVVIATGWSGTENAIALAGPENFSDKVVIDVTNPLDFSGGPPPTLAVGYPLSSGLIIQRLLPDAKVVKAFNIVSAAIMIDPSMANGAPALFIAGDDENAKAEVERIARGWGWSEVHDAGGIDNSYLLEALALLWISHGLQTSKWTHAFGLVSK